VKLVKAKIDKSARKGEMKKKKIIIIKKKNEKTCKISKDDK
jgi:hypothetical protein